MKSYEINYRNADFFSKFPVLIDDFRLLTFFDVR